MATTKVDPVLFDTTGTASSSTFLRGDGAWAAGKVVQVVTANTTAVATGTTAFPTDDTIPQNNEGVEIETLAITPTNASNLLYFWFNSVISHTANGTVVIALFQDSTANALAATEAVLTATNNGQCSLHHQMTAGTTSATTFKIRIGGQTASTLTVNGNGGTRRYAGTSTCRLTIMEVSA